MVSGNAPTPLVSIIMPLYGPHCYVRTGLPALVDSLPGWPNPELPVELLMIENSGQTVTAEFAAALGGPSRVIPASVPCTFAAANNLGAAQAQGKWLLLLNFDTVPLAGWLSALIDAAEATGAAIVGSQLRYPDETIQHAGLAFDSAGDPVSLYHMQPVTTPAVAVPRQARAVTGAVFLIAREAFEQLGGFDERYRNSYEDLDLCCRARMAGLTIQYAPQSQLYHFSSVNDVRFSADEPNRALFLATWREQLAAEQEEWAAIEGPGLMAEAAVEEVARNLTPAEIDEMLIAARTRLSERLWRELRHLTWDQPALKQQAEAAQQLQAELTETKAAFAQQEAWQAELVQQLAEREQWCKTLEARLQAVESQGLRAQFQRWRRP